MAGGDVMLYAASPSARWGGCPQPAASTVAPDSEEIWINEPSRVFIAREGRHELTTTILTRAQVDDLVERLLKTSGRRVDLSLPFVDATLPAGHRVHVVLNGASLAVSPRSTSVVDRVWRGASDFGP